MSDKCNNQQSGNVTDATAIWLSENAHLPTTYPQHCRREAPWLAQAAPSHDECADDDKRVDPLLTFATIIYWHWLRCLVAAGGRNDPCGCCLVRARSAVISCRPIAAKSTSLGSRFGAVSHPKMPKSQRLQHTI